MCKYGYPRERSSEPLAKSDITGRNIYRCELKEDEKLPSSIVVLQMSLPCLSRYLRWKSRASARW